MSVPDSEVLKLENVSKSFDGHQVLVDVNAVVQKGEVVAIIGNSGEGKTTILRCMALLDPIDAGIIRVCGRTVLSADGATSVGVHFWTALASTRQRIGIVFQNLNLWPHKTALGNVIEGLIVVKRIPRTHAVEQGKAALNRVGLYEKCNAYPAALSGGQQRRVAIARALVMEPELLLLDESTAGLDPELVNGILDLIEGLARSGTTIVIVSHELRFVRDIGDRVLFLHNGRIEVEGPPRDIFEKADNPDLRRFLQGFGRTHFAP